jgi:hypothetical protein
MTPKPTRGGARKGAGRKPRTIPRKSITVRLEPQDADRLRELCRSEEMSQANWIAKQIRHEALKAELIQMAVQASARFRAEKIAKQIRISH